MWHSARFSTMAHRPSNWDGPAYLTKSTEEFNGKHCQVSDTKRVLNKGGLPSLLALSDFIYSSGQVGGGSIIHNLQLTREEAGAPCQAASVLRWWRDFHASLLRGMSRFYNTQVIPFVVCEGLWTSLLFLLAVCHLALSLLISTSTTVQRGKSKRVSLG